MLKLIKTLLKIILVFLLVIIATFVWAFYNPGQAFQIAEKYFLPKDLKITWQKIDFQASRQANWSFPVDWNIEGLLVTKKDPLIYLPVDKIHVQTTIKALDRKVLIEKIDVTALSKIEYKASEFKDPKPEKNFFQHLQSVVSILETIQKRAPVRNINIQISQVQISDSMSLGARAEMIAPSSALRFTIRLTKTGTNPLAAKVSGYLDVQNMNTEKEFLKTDVSFQGYNVDLNQELIGRYADEKAYFVASGPVTYAKDKLTLLGQPRLELSLKPNAATLEIDTQVSGIPGPIPQVKDAKIKIMTPLDEDILFSEKPSEFSVNIPVSLEYMDPTLKGRLQKACQCQFPLSLFIKADGRIWLAGLLNEAAKNKTVLDTTVKVENVKNRLFSIDLASDLRIEKNKATWNFFPVLNCGASIYDLQGVKPLLDAYKIPIPAPLDVLSGGIHLFAKGPVSQANKASRFPARITMDLSSKKQLIKLQSDAEVLLNHDFKKAHLDLAVKVDDFQLELPPLDPIGGKPRITSDSRLLKTPPSSNKETKFEMSFNIQVDTVKPGAIRLISEFFKPYLPLTLNLKIKSDTANNGFVQAEPFDVVYLRRKVRVEKLRLDINQIDEDILPVDGRFKIQQTQYTIYIDIKGNAKNPNITFTSDPELTESEIISVLLYDRTSDQLVSADAETSGSVQAAVADRAIGLFGLWAFASTPIKSFYYNPVSKIYTATVSLGDGVTAGIGTTWESTAQFELRKRVSRSWMLTARWTAATAQEAQNSELVLQWEKRY